MALTPEKAQTVDRMMGIIREKLNIPPIGKYTIPDNVRDVLERDLFSSESVSALAYSMMSHMRLPYEPIDLRINVDTSPNRNISYRPAGEYAYYGVYGRNQIVLTLTPEDTPDSVCALLSHEMSHHHLYGKHIMISPDKDNEILTDIAAVYFGFAVYMLCRYSDEVVKNVSFSEMMKLRSKPSTIGYIDKDQIRYAMRRCDDIRREYRNGTR